MKLEQTLALTLTLSLISGPLAFAQPATVTKTSIETYTEQGLRDAMGAGIDDGAKDGIIAFTRDFRALTTAQKGEVILSIDGQTKALQAELDRQLELKGKYGVQADDDARIEISRDLILTGGAILIGSAALAVASLPVVGGAKLTRAATARFDSLSRIANGLSKIGYHGERAALIALGRVAGTGMTALVVGVTITAHDQMTTISVKDARALQAAIENNQLRLQLLKRKYDAMSAVMQ